MMGKPTTCPYLSIGMPDYRESSTAEEELEKTPSGDLPTVKPVRSNSREVPLMLRHVA